MWSQVPSGGSRGRAFEEMLEEGCRDLQQGCSLSLGKDRKNSCPGCTGYFPTPSTSSSFT